MDQDACNGSCRLWSALQWLYFLELSWCQNLDFMLSLNASQSHAKIQFLKKNIMMDFDEDMLRCRQERVGGGGGGLKEEEEEEKQQQQQLPPPPPPPPPLCLSVAPWRMQFADSSSSQLKFGDPVKPPQQGSA
ncbi:Hypothetical predicted protein [Xyrichtys novacula]|uniref:Uncharacterized protein n=1 Tax=Xyrichtys novacula TaxID=13765 RepID=A0AAV1EX58_XYRNO|nr:Hypothetical predicted protein [Xyrichtys novacula]